MLISGKSIVIAAVALIIIGINIQVATSKSNGSPLANTGSPGDGPSNTCAKGGCHVSVVNSFPGNVSIDVSDIPAQGYTPGETYTIGVQVTESGRFTFGFQLTAEDINKNKMGSYTPGTGVRKEFTNWVTHSTESASGSWTFDWTAPSGAEDITFYASGNAANGNGTASGDHIYTTSATVSRSVFASIDLERSYSNISVLTMNGYKSIKIIAEKGGLFRIYNQSGLICHTVASEPGTTVVNLSDLNTGLYIIVHEEGTYSQRVLLN